MSPETKANSIVSPSTISTATMNGTSPKQETSSSLGSQDSPSQAFSKLVEALRECSKYESAYSDIEGTQIRLVRKESELKCTEEKLQTEKSNHRHLITRQAEEFKIWDTEKQGLEAAKKKLSKTLEDERKKMEEMLKEERKKIEEMQRENGELKSKLGEEKEKIASLERSWNDEKTNSTRLETELTRTKRSKSELNSKLIACQEELREWKSYVAVLRNVDVGDFSNKMHNLWTRFEKFAEKYFFVNLAESLFEDLTQWDNLIKPLQVVEGIPPLPPRNSVAAKQMRMASVLAILADCIDYRIFAPMYTGARDDGIRELLFHHAETDINSEAACRALVLSGYTEDHQKEAAQILVLDVVNQVSGRVECFLSPGVIDSFRAELKTLIHEAVTLWWLAQRSSQKIETSVEEEEGWEWNNLSIFDSAVDRPASGHFQIALFPRVIIARDDDDWPMVFPGAALWEWQTTAAEQEWQEHKAAIKAARRPTSLRGPGLSGRRMSRVDGNGNAPGSPTSPTKTSFLDRRKSGAGRGDG